MYISNQRSALLECWGCGGSLSFRAGFGEHIDVCIIEMICHYYSSSLVCSYRVINVNIIITTYCAQACKEIHFLLFLLDFYSKKCFTGKCGFKKLNKTMQLLPSWGISATLLQLIFCKVKTMKLFKFLNVLIWIYCDNSVHENLHCNNLHNC